MKINLVTLIFLLMFQIVEGQFMGGDIIMEESAPLGLTDIVITVNKYYDFSVSNAPDSVVVFSALQSAFVNYGGRKLPKINETQLYDSVYQVTYKREFSYFELGISLFDEDVSLHTADTFSSSGIINYTGTYNIARLAATAIDASISLFPLYPVPTFYLSNGYLIHHYASYQNYGTSVRLLQINTTHTYGTELLIDTATQTIRIDTSLSGKYLLYYEVSQEVTSFPRMLILDLDRLKQSIATNTVRVSQEELDFTLYPNPAMNFINLEFPLGVELAHIYNSSGQLVWENRVFGETLGIDLSEFSNGTYFVRLKKGETWLSKQFVIRR